MVVYGDALQQSILANTPAIVPTTERNADEVVIEVRGLRNQFGTHVVHENLDLDVYKGDILGVVGGSGAGKSVYCVQLLG